MIDFEHVYKTYETHNDENVALEDINIHIDEGEFVFILGHSGAGKSTFLKLIQMEEKPTEGKVFINGQDLTRIKRRKVPYLRRQMGVVFQDFRLIPTMTVYENVAFAMRVTNISTKKIKDRVPFALSLVGLEDKMDRLPDELSGGEQQRVAVARALAHGPKLIIADEPTGNIDPEMSMDIMQLFEAINKVNITVVVVTHEHELVHKLARKYGNRVITLANGMVASDTADPAAARRYAAAMAEREEDDYEYDEDRFVSKRGHHAFFQFYLLSRPGPAQPARQPADDLCLHGRADRLHAADRRSLAAGHQH